MTPFHPDIDSAIEEAIDHEKDMEAFSEEKQDTRVLHVSPDFKCFLCEGKHSIKSCPEIFEFRKLLASPEIKRLNELPNQKNDPKENNQNTNKVEQNYQPRENDALKNEDTNQTRGDFYRNQRPNLPYFPNQPNPARNFYPNPTTNRGPPINPVNYNNNNNYPGYNPQRYNSNPNQNVPNYVNFQDRGYYGNRNYQSRNPNYNIPVPSPQEVHFSHRNSFPPHRTFQPELQANRNQNFVPRNSATNERRLSDPTETNRPRNTQNYYDT